MPEAETVEQRERRELTALLWFFWVGILVTCAGESALVFMMERPEIDPGSGSSSVHTLVVGALAVAMWAAAALIYRKEIGGGGFPTAIFCWMLAKGTAILAFAMYFLAPGWSYTWMLLGGFLLTMLILRPQRFLSSL